MPTNRAPRGVYARKAQLAVALSDEVLGALADEAMVERRRRRAFIAELREVLAEYAVAAHQVDRNRLRDAKTLLRKLRDAVRFTRELVTEIEQETGVIHFESWTGGDTGIAPELFDLTKTLVVLEREAAVLYMRASKPGRPTTWSTRYTIGRLVALLRRYEGSKPRTFSRRAMAAIGVTVTARQVREAIKVGEREGSIPVDK